ncbi:MAG: nucleoside-diphosphate sugar epimerase [Deltaproteobacteria bacterium RIFCSPLOWO2_02_FULL_50_16]|nr:MAG: nucleoside-diphosphate sugar epimerase [Deltaproteobacteria bacterium RIFCSPHIGHO2_02_FULL_50_15]OGQ57905.1 MAG: nucleoside-diphosphate sugar epimerase [Deltaproteobacteria bacterium RIFCSPLOWO2_02_FULL_50_16]OGQ66180.1 MAG: nucleoside-diphosphate sugar epimerase [Deltaproteobacteria bacterium RIFCSPLOWO2_12_FULL_50_11]
MRILITGGAGFIGSHLAEKYLKSGNEVYIIDNLATSTEENIQHLIDNPDYKNLFFPTIDTIFNVDKLTELVGICDVVFHMAAAVGVEYILKNPLSSIVTNIRGTENVLDLCRKFKKRVLIASTSEVYGKHEHAPLVETDNSIYGPSNKSRWSYAAAKLMDEFTALAHHRESGLPVFIVRLFNTVGPRQSAQYGMVLPRFIQRAINHNPILVYGDGKQTRTFTYIDDVVEALIKLIETDKAIGEVVNIGGSEEISMKSLALRIKEMTKSPSEIRHIPYDEAFTKDFEDMRRRVPSLEKLYSLIGWKPQINLQTILEKTIQFYQDIPQKVKN